MHTPNASNVFGQLNATLLPEMPILMPNFIKSTFKFTISLLILQGAVSVMYLFLNKTTLQEYRQYIYFLRKLFTVIFGCKAERHKHRTLNYITSDNIDAIVSFDIINSRPS